MKPDRNDDIPLVSVVIPAHNAANAIGEQLGALRAQINAPRFEVLVCDNNSTDETSSAALGAAGDLDLKVIGAAGKGSASFARNRGAEAALGQSLLFTDADDMVGHSWVSALSEPLLSHSDAITVGKLQHERFNSKAVLYAYDIGPDSTKLADPSSPAPLFAGYLPTLAGSNFGIRREHYLALGGMDASYPGGSEETDFGWRAQEAGAEVLIVPSAIVEYRLRSSATAIRRQQRIQQYARVLLWVRYGKSGMTGPSAAYSLREVLRTAAPSLFARDEKKKLRANRVLGGNIGALQGILHFRILRQRPQAAEQWWARAGEDES